MVTSIPINLPQPLRVTDEQFLQFVKANPELRLERTATGELKIMVPTGSESGSYNAELTTELSIWNRKQRTGKVFDSSSGFHLPNGAIRSPDAAWVAIDRWHALNPDQQKGFAPLCPDFVIELLSTTDTWAEIRAKMLEYTANGCRLGWLIDPNTKTVEIYRPDQAPRTVSFPVSLSGEDVLPDFELRLPALFQN